MKIFTFLYLESIYAITSARLSIRLNILRLFKLLFFIFTFLIVANAKTFGQTCTITQTVGCPSDIVSCSPKVTWTPPLFELSCGTSSSTGWDYIQKFDLPENGNICWSFNKVQRVGSENMRLWQSTGPDVNPWVLTPAFYFPTGKTNVEIDISAELGHHFTCNVSLYDGATSSLVTTIDVLGTGITKQYPFQIDKPVAGTSKIRFEFINITGGNNKDYIDNLFIDALS